MNNCSILVWASYTALLQGLVSEWDKWLLKCELHNAHTRWGLLRLTSIVNKSCIYKRQLHSFVNTYRIKSVFYGVSWSVGSAQYHSPSAMSLTQKNVHNADARKEVKEISGKRRTSLSAAFCCLTDLCPHLKLVWCQCKVNAKWLLCQWRTKRNRHKDWPATWLGINRVMQCSASSYIVRVHIYMV